MAIARCGGLGYPPVCVWVRLSMQLFDEMRRRKQKYGVVIRRTADVRGPGIHLRITSADKEGRVLLS